MMNSKMKRMSALVIMLSCTMSSNILMAQAPGYEQGRAIGQQIIGGLFKKKNKSETQAKKDKKEERRKRKLEDAMESMPQTRAQGSNSAILVVSGNGHTKDEATRSALRSAIEQAFGTFVSSNTNILNDELVKDEIVTISSGNITNYKILTENENNGNWYVTVQARVSIEHLIEYAKSKGSEAELAGATFAMDIKMKQLNKKNEEVALGNLKEQLARMYSNCFDYDLVVDEPKASSGGMCIVPITVVVKTNRNINACYELFTKTMKALSLSQQEVDEYKKKALPFNYIGVVNSDYVQKRYSGGVEQEPIDYFYIRNSSLSASVGFEFFKDLCMFKIFDGLTNYIAKYEHANRNSTIHTGFYLSLNTESGQKVCDDIKSNLLYERGDKFIYRDGEEYTPYLVTPYGNRKVAEIKFSLHYSLEQLSKVSKISISPIWE